MKFRPRRRSRRHRVNSFIFHVDRSRCLSLDPVVVPGFHPYPGPALDVGSGLELDSGSVQNIHDVIKKAVTKEDSARGSARVDRMHSFSLHIDRSISIIDHNTDRYPVLFRS
ncbi:hypothetical protein EVAR_5589_1 [Eumeta japonica]|uniref:Uncharacterized protein n=1 Tax=Eumeta variegata TaxID=151549 RepID=A0A4C1U1J2_EUMVA|nr:hypothetical protein EVAR_5589_1 [Eumeta japonica]